MKDTASGIVPIRVSSSGGGLEFQLCTILDSLIPVGGIRRVVVGGDDVATLSDRTGRDRYRAANRSLRVLTNAVVFDRAPLARSQRRKRRTSEDRIPRNESAGTDLDAVRAAAHGSASNDGSAQRGEPPHDTLARVSTVRTQLSTQRTPNPDAITT